MSPLLFILRPLLRHWARKAAPQTRGAIPVPGLEGKVEIVSDPFAVPYVSATDEHDLFLAQGYLHARERLWQMDMNRRLLSGRLAEILGDGRVPWKELSVHFRGKKMADLDFFIRLIGVRKSACDSLRILPEDLVRHLQAYCQGVNRYIETHLKRLPLEFRLLRYEPEPWSPEDSLTVGKGFAFFLSTSLLTRLTCLALAERLKDQPAKRLSLLPRYPADGPAVTRPVADAGREMLRFVNGTFKQLDWPVGSQGSNNWVVAPSRSTTGKPILCNDPHLRMALPSIWYLMSLRATACQNPSGEFEAWGASIPGSPCIHLGHNRQIAWGVTAAICDDGDLYLEKAHPQEPDLYLREGRWAKMDCREEQISIRWRKGITRKVRSTCHGPVISDFTGLENRPAQELLAFKWTAHEASEELRCLYGVNRARNWDEFLASLAYQTAPTLNYVFADSAGNIGYSLAGRVPLRRSAPSLLPLAGWSAEGEWEGYIPFEQLPRLYNPPEGVIATANNRVAGDSYPYHLSDLFDAPYRIRRARQLLTSKDKFSPEEMAELQKDVVSLHAKELVKTLRAELEESARKEPGLKQNAEILLRWDGECREESVEAALFHVFHQRLMRNLLLPDLGEELFLAYTGIFNQSLIPTDQILHEPQSPWFSSCARQPLVQKSLRETQEELARRLGSDSDQWRWGDLHTLTLSHPLGRVRILAPLFSIGPFPSPGDGTTINMGFYHRSSPYDHVVGPSLRMIIDLSRWEKSSFIIPGGQSGDPFSGHYRDQAALWRRHEYIHFGDVEEPARDGARLCLTPIERQATRE